MLATDFIAEKNMAILSVTLLKEIQASSKLEYINKRVNGIFRERFDRTSLFLLVVDSPQHQPVL